MLAWPSLARCLGRLLLTLGCCAQAWLGSAWAASAPAPVPAEAGLAPVVVGSKRFTESYLLGELVTQTLRAAGVNAVHRQGLGNTAIVSQALQRGEIAVYPEYTGTIARELLKAAEELPAAPTLQQLNARLSSMGLLAAVPLGFNNSYALGLREADAARLGLETISDLARLPVTVRSRLRLAFSHEFLVRADGWPGLKQAYGLDITPGPGLDHGLAFQALAAGQVDLIDVYSTDAQIARLGLRVLRDDRGFFPRYDAVLLMRRDLPAAAQQALAALQGRFDEAAMVGLNARAEIDRQPFAEVARSFLASADVAEPAQASAGQSPRSFAAQLFAPDLPRLLAQHLGLVFGSLAGAVALGVPLGVLGHWRPRLGVALRLAVGLLQTVPSLALLAVLVAALGRIGFLPALLALWAYALLPIVGNTMAGLAGVPAGLLQAARALGLGPAAVLRHVALPLALPVLLAGVTTAAVINVGTATVAAFVGAGGLGERIVAGLAVNDPGLLLAGALPAAMLALLVQLAFAALERSARHENGPAAWGRGPFNAKRGGRGVCQAPRKD